MEGVFAGADDADEAAAGDDEAVEERRVARAEEGVVDEFAVGFFELEAFEGGE